MPDNHCFERTCTADGSLHQFLAWGKGCCAAAPLPSCPADRPSSTATEPCSSTVLRRGCCTGCTLRDRAVRVQVAVPRYDKAAHEGRGTRAPESSWPRVKGPLDIILFEGWMLGFSPVRPQCSLIVQAMQATM